MSVHLEILFNDLLNESFAGAATLWIVDENLSVTELQTVRPRKNLFAITNRCDIAVTLRELGHQVTLNDFCFSELPVQEFSSIVYRVSKERTLVNHCINESYKLLSMDGALHLLGNKDDGIKTHGKHAEQVFRVPARLKKQGTSYRSSLAKMNPKNAPAEPKWLDSKDYEQLREKKIEAMEFMSKPGVYGWDKLDRGSVLLANQARKQLSGKSSAGSVLDLGCGYGYLLLATKDLLFTTRTATDNNAAAVAAAQASFKLHDLSVTVTLDDCGGALQEKFDLILCNPPFHLGFSTSGDLSQKFLLSIRQLLARKGQALVVVNQFIPLERLAAARFQQVTTLTKEHGFKVVLLS